MTNEYEIFPSLRILLQLFYFSCAAPLRTNQHNEHNNTDDRHNQESQQGQPAVCPGSSGVVASIVLLQGRSWERFGNSDLQRAEPEQGFLLLQDPSQVPVDFLQKLEKHFIILPESVVEV